MKPPRVFRTNDQRQGFSICEACRQWKVNNRFRHEGRNWILCKLDYADYWENTDRLQPDYKEWP